MKIVIINGSHRKNGATAIILNEMYEKLRKHSNVSGQMKVIIDRGHFVMEQLLYGKYAISVSTYENYGGRDTAKIIILLL